MLTPQQIQQFDEKYAGAIAHLGYPASQSVLASSWKSREARALPVRGMQAQSDLSQTPLSSCRTIFLEQSL